MRVDPRRGRNPGDGTPRTSSNRRRAIVGSTVPSKNPASAIPAAHVRSLPRSTSASTCYGPACIAAGGAGRRWLLLFYLGSRATSAAVAWLHRQSQYQVAFDEIQLVTEPPELVSRGKARVSRAGCGELRASRADLSARGSARAAGAGVQDGSLGRRGRQGRRTRPGRIAVDLAISRAGCLGEAPRAAAADRRRRRDGSCPPKTSTSSRLGPLIKITGDGSDGLRPIREPGVVWKSQGRGGDDRRRLTSESSRRPGWPASCAQQDRDRRGPSLAGAADDRDHRRRDFRQSRPVRAERRGRRDSAGERPRGRSARRADAPSEKWQMLLKWAESTPGNARWRRRLLGVLATGTVARLHAPAWPASSPGSSPDRRRRQARAAGNRRSLGINAGLAVPLVAWRGCCAGASRRLRDCTGTMSRNDVET